MLGIFVLQCSIANRCVENFSYFIALLGHIHFKCERSPEFGISLKS